MFARYHVVHRGDCEAAPHGVRLIDAEPATAAKRFNRHFSDPAAVGKLAVIPICRRPPRGRMLGAHKGGLTVQFMAELTRAAPKRRRTMATFIILSNFTDQGIRNIKDSPDRYGAWKAIAEKMGVTVKAFYYTVGHHDMVTILEGTDEAVATALLKAGSLGNLRTETLRGFSVDEAKRMIGNIP